MKHITVLPTEPAPVSEGPRQGLICKYSVGVGVYETPMALSGRAKPRIIQLGVWGSIISSPVAKACLSVYLLSSSELAPIVWSPVSIGLWARAPFTLV